MNRHLVNLLAGISLLAGVAISGLWARSAWSFDGFQRTSWRVKDNVVDLTVVTLDLGGGVVFVDLNHRRWRLETQEQRELFFGAQPGLEGNNTGWYHEPRGASVWTKPRRNSLSSRVGFNWDYYHYDGNQFRNQSRYGTIPYWSVMLASLMLLTACSIPMLRRAQTEHRFRQLRCVVCGYDLRATPDRCPECGRVPEKLPGQF